MNVAGYTDLVLLCRGGFSTVYRARQLAMDRPVAVKVLDLALTDPQARERFRRECAAAGRVGAHPAIVTVHDSGFTGDGRPFLSMELCEGGSLSDLLRSAGPLPVEQVLRVGVAIAGALAFAHNAGVLHRDVKPGNILLTGFGEPVLTDFGIAALDGYALSTQTSSSFTVAHAAPECLAGHPSTRASDLYSLASTLFTLLSGHPPYQVPESASPVALAVKVIDGPVPQLTREGVPDSLVSLLETGMAKQPDRRPVDVSVFGHELQRIQSEGGWPVTEWVTAPGQESWDEPVAAPAVAETAAGSAAAVGLILPDADDRRTRGGAAAAAASDRAAWPQAGGPMPEPLPTAAVPAAELLADRAPGGPDPEATAAGPAAELLATADPAGHGPPGRVRSDLSPAALGMPPGVPLDPLSPLPVGADSPPPRRRAPGWTVAAALALLVLAGAALFVFRLATGGEPAGGSSGLADAAAAEPSGSSGATGSPSSGADRTSKVPTISSLSAAGGGSPTAPCPSSDAVAMVGLTWNATDASTAWLAVDSGTDASVHPLRSSLPPTVGPGNPDHAVEQVPFDCSASQHTYTLTVLGPGGKVSRSIVYSARQASGSVSPGVNPAADRASVTAQSRESSAGTSPSTPSGSITASTSGATSSPSTAPSTADLTSAAPTGGTPTTALPTTASPSPVISSVPPTTSSSAPLTSSSATTSAASTDVASSSAPPTTQPTSDPVTDPGTTASAITESTAPTTGNTDGADAGAGTATATGTVTSGIAPTTGISADAV